MLTLRDQHHLPLRPTEVMDQVQWQASQLGVRLNVKLEGRYPTGPNGESLGSYMVAVGCEIGGSIGQAENMARIIQQTCTPAEKTEIEGWLAELSVLVARRPGDEFSESLRLEAYSSRLFQYPADIAREAVLGKTWKFWPTWEELERVCDQLYAPRKHMMAACLNPSPAAEQIPSEPRVSGDKAEEICADLGFTPKRFGRVQKQPLAQSVSELRDVKQEARPHWSDTAKPDDPRWDELRRARSQNELMNPRKVEAAE